MTKYNPINGKDLVALASIAKKKGRYSLRPVLERVMVNNDVAVATDSYALLEVRHTNKLELDGEVHIPKELIDKHKKELKKARLPISLHSEHLAVEGAEYAFQSLEAEFPNYKICIPNGEPKARIKVNAKKLNKLLKTFENNGECSLWLEIHDSNHPLVLKGEGFNDNKRGLLMPMK